MIRKRVFLGLHSQTPTQKRAAERNWIILRLRGVLATLKALSMSEHMTSASKKDIDVAYWHIKALVDKGRGIFR